MAKNLRVSICAYSACREGRRFDLEKNLADIIGHVRLAKGEKADLAVFPEIAAVADCPEWTEQAEPLDGPVIGRLAGEARRLGIGIAFGHVTAEKGKRYNSLILLDRRGKIAAVYHKVYPTITELEKGIAPGAQPVVADTEFGRVGLIICYDLNFAELRLAYRDLRPELMLFSSFYRGGLQARWWAHELRSYLVSSVIDPKSVIVNPVGRVIAETDAFSRSVTKTINLDYTVLHLDYVNRNLHHIRQEYGADFEFEWAEPEGVMLATAIGEKNIKQLRQKTGWEDVETYLNRARAARKKALAGKKIPPGTSPW